MYDVVVPLKMFTSIPPHPKSVLSLADRCGGIVLPPVYAGLVRVAMGDVCERLAVTVVGNSAFWVEAAVCHRLSVPRLVLRYAILALLHSIPQLLKVFLFC